MDAEEESGRKRSAPDAVAGFPHIIAAAGYSLDGLGRLWRETAFRHQVLAAGLLLPVYVAAHATPFEIVLFVMLAFLTFAFEALNTAIEELTDRVSPDWSETAKHAKDLGSLAVALSMMAHLVLLIWVVGF
ncbi:diacylglycerol kinase [Thioclava sp. A2]|uniref:diacylglycerol kinase n=1 Tax=Thioclava sp. FCG-A2 TaxID=3080562 RepID=UPI002954C4F7|nr:diacylglycerol kinase [Thioclava sp. A2]MDV7270949.1 diacylglycerol kinase [Thioclava sp. A2]